MSPAAGLADPVHGAQAVFRQVLDAMARPGRVHELPAGLFEHPSRPPLPLGTAAAAVLLTLCDHETALWSRLRPGTDVAPHTSATLIVEVDALDSVPDEAAARLDGEAILTLEGPGIERVARLRVAGIAREVWEARIAQSAHYPCGVDLLLCCGHRIAGLPRSTHVTRLEA